jgi:hypothetical protein
LKRAGFALGGRVVVLTCAKDQLLRRRAIELAVIEKNDAWIQDTRDPNDPEHSLFDGTLKGLPENDKSDHGTVVLIEDLNIRSRGVGRLKTEISQESS